MIDWRRVINLIILIKCQFTPCPLAVSVPCFNKFPGGDIEADLHLSLIIADHPGPFPTTSCIILLPEKVSRSKSIRQINITWYISGHVITIKRKGNPCTQNLPAPASAGQVNPVAGRPLPSPALGRCDQSTQSSSLLWTTLNFVTLVHFQNIVNLWYNHIVNLWVLLISFNCYCSDFELRGIKFKAKSIGL